LQSLGFDIANNDLIKIALAVLCGGVLGLERQYKNKTAGFRTIILICLGSTVFTMVAQRTGQVANINIVTGVGFIGAGVVFKDSINVSGLTTAAVIWISAAIGMAVGSGNYGLSLYATLLTLLVLLVFNQLELYIDKVHHDKLFIIVFTNSDYENMEPVQQIIEKQKLKSRIVQITKKEGCLQAAIMVTGHHDNIRLLDEKLLIMPQIKSF